MDENWKNQFVFETIKYEIRIITLYSILGSIIQGIDERFNQETMSICSGVDKMLKFELSKNDTELLINHCDHSKETLECLKHRFRGHA